MIRDWDFLGHTESPSASLKSLTSSLNYAPIKLMEVSRYTRKRTANLPRILNG